MKTRVIYGWRAGSRISIDAQGAGEAIESLQRAQNGPLEPETIVEAARDAKSVLHDAFEWNDGEAAHQFRVGQARDLVRSLTIDVSRSNLETKPVRAFVNVETGTARGYVTTATALSSDELRKQVITRAWSELEAWRHRYAELVELGRIFQMVDAGIEALPDA